MFIITLDTDWVPQFVLDHALALLAEHGTAATVFCTGPYDLAAANVEAALHPNFLPGSTQGHDPDEILATLKGYWPKAVGSRSHRLFWHSGLRAVLKRHGIRYDCSSLLPLCPQSRPADSGGLLHTTIWWSDNQHMVHSRDPKAFELPGRDEPGLKVLLFHPIHIYLNTVNLEDYRRGLRNLPPFQELRPEDLAPLRRSGPGMETFFKAVLGHLQTTQSRTPTLEQIIAEHHSV